MSIDVDLASLKQELIILLKDYLTDKSNPKIKAKMVNLFERVGYGGSALFDKEINQALGLIEDIGYQVSDIYPACEIKDELIIDLISKLELLKVRRPLSSNL